MLPPRYIRDAMKAKYPAANFGPYFAFLTSCTARPKGKTHRHHIAPRHQFPQYAKDRANLIALAVSTHVQAHRVLTKVCPPLRMATPSPEFIAAASRGAHSARLSPLWQAANRNQVNNPKWLAATAAANRKLAKDPKWQAAMRKYSQELRRNGTKINQPINVSVRKALAVVQRQNAYKRLVLPEKKIIRWYLAGMGLRVIARKVGTGTCPNNKKNERVGRIRNVLIHAGVYIKPARTYKEKK